MSDTFPNFDGPLIQVTSLVKRFGSKTVLDGINLDIAQGERLCIVGGSGSGKSTLLNCLIAELRPEEGNVKINGQDICGMSRKELDAYRMKIGVSFQSGALFNSMSIGDNIALPLREHTDLEEETIDIVVKMKLELVGLRDAADRLPSEISGGMKKRAGVARAIVMDPQIVYYDEPTAGLDPISTARFDELIIKLNKTLGMTTVMVSHEMESIFRVATRIVLLHHGKFVASGTVDEMRNHEDPLVRQFMNGDLDGPLSDNVDLDKYRHDLLGTSVTRAVADPTRPYR